MLTPRIKKAKENYLQAKPAISIERARIWTESHQRTEGMSVPLRRATAFRDTCEQLVTTIFEGELIVGAVGEFRKCGILTPEFSWTWVDREMDHFEHRVQDPYYMSDEQRAYVRQHIFPYWRGKSLEESFLAQVDPETAKLAVDNGIVDNDSKWRQAVGEITPDYQDVIFAKGYLGIIAEAKEKLATLSPSSPEDLKPIDFYKSVILTSEGLLRLGQRYAELARDMAAKEDDALRKSELLEIARICDKVPANPPESFQEALQMLWFVQLGGILSENPLALNPGRFDQYMYPYYRRDMDAGIQTDDSILELIEAYWFKLSEWVWTISANTADFFAGYNQFQNLTLGGTKRDGSDATNELSYLYLKATAETRTHQPGLSVRITQDCPKAFLDAITHLVSLGTGFPALHSDSAGYRMLIHAGYEAEDARDWNNCGCVVPHYRKTYEWTSAVNVNFAAALEYATHGGKSRLTGERMGITRIPAAAFDSYDKVEATFFEEFDHLIEVSVEVSLLAQKLHKEMVPRPFLSSTHEFCLKHGIDLVDAGSKYNLGPVLTGIGLAVCANSLAVIRKLVFDEKVVTMAELFDALDNNWEGFETLRQAAMDVPKYGNDDEFVDAIARKISNHFYEKTHRFLDLNGNPFNSAFMGISNFLPTGKVLGATPDGRKARDPISEGVSPYAGSDRSTPLAAMRSAAKLNQDMHSGGTLLNLRLNHDLVNTKRGQSNLAAMIQSFFSLGGFHVQFNTLSTETLLDAQLHPEAYRDLLVRVAGYSTQFVNLSKSMQDSIIARQSHHRF